MVLESTRWSHAITIDQQQKKHTCSNPTGTISSITAKNRCIRYKFPSVTSVVFSNPVDNVLKSLNSPVGPEQVEKSKNCIQKKLKKKTLIKKQTQNNKSVSSPF